MTSADWPQARSPFNLPPGETNKKATRIIKDIRLIPPNPPLPPTHTPLFSLPGRRARLGSARLCCLSNSITTEQKTPVKRDAAEYRRDGADGFEAFGRFYVKK